MNHANEQTPITIFPDEDSSRISNSKEEARIIAIIRKNVLSRRNEAYYTIKVKIKRQDNGLPEALIVYMLRKNTYTADVVKVKVDHDYNIQEIIENYTED